MSEIDASVKNKMEVLEMAERESRKVLVCVWQDLRVGDVCE